MRWRASKWTPAAVFGANLDVCVWFFSCLSMMRLFRKFSQWCDCSGNSPEGVAAPCTSKSCFSSRVRMYLCLLSNGAAAPYTSRKNGFASPQGWNCLFICSEKIIISWFPFFGVAGASLNDAPPTSKLMQLFSS